MPSPNVAEDHQTKNARALSEADAAILITDAEAPEKLVNTAIETIRNPELLARMSRNISDLATPGSDELIVDEALRLINDK